MTLLQVMADNDADDVRLRTEDARLIGSELAMRGIVFDRLSIVSDLEVSQPTGGKILCLGTWGAEWDDLHAALPRLSVASVVPHRG